MDNERAGTVASSQRFPLLVSGMAVMAGLSFSPYYNKVRV